MFKKFSMGGSVAEFSPAKKFSKAAEDVYVKINFISIY